MPTPTTPDPAPQPPTAALAVPCRRCETAEGFRAHNARPLRVKGYCVPCYNTLHVIAHREGYAGPDEANDRHPYGHGDSGWPAAVEACTTPGYAATQRRAWERQRAIRDDAGPLITVTLSTGRAAAPIPTGNAWGRACEPAWCPAPWHRPLATLDEPTRAAA